MTVEPEVLVEHGVLRNGSLKGKARLKTLQHCTTTVSFQKPLLR